MPDSLNKWINGLAKTKNQTFGKIATLLGRSEITSDTWEDLEALLIQADVGSQVTHEIISALRKKTEGTGVLKSTAFMELLKDELLNRLLTRNIKIPDVKPVVILVVGVNGSGKTTSIAKLGAYFQKNGFSVMFGAADTFRAAAVDQLKVWGSRLNIPVIAGQENADPGAVTFDAVSAARAKGIDILFVDSAGRLHTRYNLMEELKKIHRVCGKALEGAPHFVWLVLDATTGQNAFQQAKVFQQAVHVDGIILAKLDSSAKGGMAFAIQQQLSLPILFAGLGEEENDLEAFSPDKFIKGIMKD